MHRRLSVLVLLTVVAGVLLAHEGHAPLPSKGSEVDLSKGLVRLTADARTALDVRTVVIGTSSKPDTLLAYASLVASWKGHAFVASRLPGHIVSLKARPGDHVQAGQLVAEVRSQELESLHLEVQSARTAAALAEKIYSNLKDSAGGIPERDILNAEVQLQQTRNALELAKVKWLALGLPQDDLDAILSQDVKSTSLLPIFSPISGTVIHSDISIGKMVEPGEHLFEVIDLSTIWARVGVLEKDIPRVLVGQPVEIRLTAYPGEVFRGKVAVVGQFLDPVTHLNDVWVKFRNPTGTEPRLLPGMSGEARIELPASTGTKSIPFTALVNDGVDRFVLVEEASAKDVSEYRKKSVIVVRETTDTVEIRSPDLFLGDRLVTRGGHELGTFFAPGVVRLSPESAHSIGLKVEPATPRIVDTVIEVPGAVYLPSDRRSLATARLPGTITRIHVDRGQRVKSGDLLAEVFSLDWLNLQFDLLREQLSADLARLQLSRLKEATKAISKRQVLEAEAMATAAANKRDSIRRRLELLGFSVEQLDALVANRVVIPTLPIRAALTGTVVSFDRLIGQALRADEPLFEIHDLTKPWVEAFVAERELARIHVGQTARVRLVSDPTLVLTGKVTRSGRTFGDAHRTLSVWIEFDHDPPCLLRHNQMARLAIVVESQPPTLAVPRSAVVHEGTRAFVFVQTADTFDRREVKTGRMDDEYTEILSGLMVGEPIAVTAADELNTAWASTR